MACGLGLYGDGISFWVVFSQLFWLKVLPGGAHLVQPRWMPEKRILGGDQTYGVSSWPFPNSSGWWRLISSVFLTRTSCPKTTHANGYYGAWPGWAVSIGVCPLTIIYMFQCYSLKSSHPGLLPQSPKVCSLHQCLFCCLACRVIIQRSNSIYMH